MPSRRRWRRHTAACWQARSCRTCPPHVEGQRHGRCTHRYCTCSRISQHPTRAHPAQGRFRVTHVFPSAVVTAVRVALEKGRASLSR
ncbi:MAG: hypothetical protein ACK53Y_03670 [bacterium]